MDPISVPEAAKASRPYCQVVSMGPPPGVSDDDCGTAEMLIAPLDTATPGIGRGQYAYFRPSTAELEILNNGGFIEFAQYGKVVQPFGATVWADPTTAPALVAPIEVTDAMVEAFGRAWLSTPEGEPGARRRAGLTAVFALIAGRPS